MGSPRIGHDWATERQLPYWTYDPAHFWCSRWVILCVLTLEISCLANWEKSGRQDLAGVILPPERLHKTPPFRSLTCSRATHWKSPTRWAAWPQQPVPGRLPAGTLFPGLKVPSHSDIQSSSAWGPQHSWLRLQGISERETFPCLFIWLVYKMIKQKSFSDSFSAQKALNTNRWQSE